MKKIFKSNFQPKYGHFGHYNRHTLLRVCEPVHCLCIEERLSLRTPKHQVIGRAIPSSEMKSVVTEVSFFKNEVRRNPRVIFEK